MRALLATLAALALSQAACGGGSLGFGFKDEPTVGPGATVEVDGTFSAEGSFAGTWTITTAPDFNAVSCKVSANGSPSAASVQVDTNESPSVALVVEMVVSPTATLDAACTVTATDDGDASQKTKVDASANVADN
jgi:hypothetical protein